MDNQIKVSLVAEALNYVKRYAGKTIVVKYGGHAMTDKTLQQSFANDLALLTLVGIKPVVLHGGGPRINQSLAAQGVQSQFIDGLRVTDSATMQVVEQVLGGEVNQEIVQIINQTGSRAIGLTGKDDSLISASPLTLQDGNGKTISLGQVGQINHINKDIIQLLIDADIIPVIAPIASDQHGTALNINADTAAAEIAIALSAEALFILTNTPGVLDQHQQLISHINAAQIQQMIDQQIISGGMQPKINCAIHAVKNGVRSCQIIDGRLPHTLLLELFTNEGAGTFIEDE